MTRLFLIIAAIGALVIGAMQLSAQAGPTGWTAYDEVEFMMAQKKGRTIVVAIGNAPVSADLIREWPEHGPTADVLYVRLDPADQAHFLAAHSVEQAPALIAFKGMEEVARVEGQIDRDWIEKVALRAR